MQRAREQSSTELTQLREQMNRLGSVNTVDKRMRKVEYKLPRLDSQVDLLATMDLSGSTSLLQAQAPSESREKDHNMAYAMQRKTMGVCAA